MIISVFFIQQSGMKIWQIKQDLEIKHYHHIYNVVLENPLDENDYPMFYEPAHGVVILI